MDYATIPCSEGRPDTVEITSIHDQSSRADLSPRANQNVLPVQPSWPPIAAADLPIEIILPRLQGVRESSAGQYFALCPYHGDSRPSLSVAVTVDDKVLVYCHAGCSAQQILGAVGLELKHLFASDFAMWHADRYGTRSIVIQSGQFSPTRLDSPADDLPPPDLRPVAEAAYRVALEGAALSPMPVT